MNPRLKSSLTVGYGEKTITPPLGIELGGYGFYLNRRAETILDDLKVRVLFLSNDTAKIILISCDLLGFSVAFSDRIRRNIASRYQISRSHILLSCTHTHSSPVTQPLLGLGKGDPDYMDSIPAAIGEAVRMAYDESGEAEFSYGFETIEPIGFNLRKGNFEDIDPIIRVVIFRKKRNNIYLFNYACHPVILGHSNDISADWPGAVIQEIENQGHKGLFFQGFCGDVDPVTNMKQWGMGTEKDIKTYGRRIMKSIRRAERSVVVEKKINLKAIEKRIRLPLEVFPKREIERYAKIALESDLHFPNEKRFIDEWKQKAYESHHAFKQRPFIDNVIIQVLIIGHLKMLGLPAEVFCKLGLDLQKTYQPLIKVGYANGNIGYISTAQACWEPPDYVSRWASKIYSLFPFSKITGDILSKESQALLKQVS